MNTIITTCVAKAVEILRNGGLAAFPTETVYGLGADAKNETAIHGIFAAKGRPHHHPLIVHIATIAELEDWAKDISSSAMKLANMFWPGPLTLILKKQLHVLDAITSGQDTIGLRIPSHPLAQTLLAQFGSGVAAPSANKFTHISPTSSAAVLEELGGKIDLVLDGGACEVGLESTIIDMTSQIPVILRPGMISAAQIEQALENNIASNYPSKIRVPGMHDQHYAPRTKTVIVETQSIISKLQALNSDDLPIVVLTWSEVRVQDEIDQIKMPNEASRYAQCLYQTLRSIDNKGYKRIMLEAVPDTMEWEAIRNRLSKAASRVSL